MLARARKMKNDEGFTLIELLIVIVILGVLSAVVVFSVSGISDRGKAAACDAETSTVTVAGEAFVAKNGTPAADAAALVSAGFLHNAPTLVSYTKSGNTFTVADVAGKC